MKYCTKCGTFKTTSEFRTNKSKKDGLQFYCLSCDKALQKEWYRKNKLRLIKKAKESGKKSATNARHFILEQLLGKKCVECGEDNILVLDFDHLGAKEFGISNGLYFGKKKIFSEIQKCQILCANCHRIKTHRERNTFKWRYSQGIRQDSAKV